MNMQDSGHILRQLKLALDSQAQVFVRSMLTFACIISTILMRIMNAVLVRTLIMAY